MHLPSLLAGALACLSCAVPASAATTESRRVAVVVDPVIEREMRRTGVPGAAFVFVRGGRILYAKGYGYSDLATKTPADAATTVWPIASITKVVTATAAMQLVERGKLKLDADVNLRLRRLKVPAQEFGPITLRHLLSHTAAFDELPGRRFDGDGRPDIASFLVTRLRRYREPGYRTAYSTYGMALVGVLVEDVSGEPYAEYLRRHIFLPAGMRSARILARRGEERAVATPYAIEDGVAAPVAHEFYVTTATSSMVSTAADMGRLLAALLRSDGKLLRRATFMDMVRQQSTNHPAVPGWGLGFQLDRVNGLRIAEHGGDIAGFSALLVVIPDRDEGFFIVNHGEGGDLRWKVKEALMHALHPATAPAMKRAPAQTAASLAEYAGKYLSSTACRSCPGAADDAFEVVVNADGSLSLWGQKWLPAGRDLFIRDDGRRLLGFSRGRDGKIDTVTGGSWRVADRLP